MKHLMISAIAAVAVLATTIALLWSHTPSTKLSAGTASMPSLQEFYTAANANKLPNQKIEDLSLIFQGVVKP
jgi:C4-dicarboxylate transporter